MSVTFCGIAPFIHSACIIFRASKNYLGNELEYLKSCDIAGKSHVILSTELWGSRYEELLHLVKSYIIDIWELRKALHWPAAVSKLPREEYHMPGIRFIPGSNKTYCQHKILLNYDNQVLTCNVNT